MNLLTLLLTTLSLLPTPSYTQESSTSSSDEDTFSSSTSSFTVTAYRSNSPINNLALTIFSGRFYLGGRTSSYCPPGVASEGECPPGNETIIVGDNGLVRTPSPPYTHPHPPIQPPTNTTPSGDLNHQSVSVPGGQQIYILSTGALSFTAPHSSYMPPGSSTGPFSYTPGTPYGSWNYTGSPGGFIACPVKGGGGSSSSSVPGGSSSTPKPSSTPTPSKHSGTPSSSYVSPSVSPSATPGAGGGRWIVYVNWKNATVPGGNVNECLGFGARAWGRNASVGAWEYI
ncbi:hypothetical protein AKAW_08713 [Aspergillus luchuensis IFO 4308]|nr:hypothetical protein AKAW_08713 [Aspergillus luchuensis IFO 4308]